jgi:hypothetical protein
MSEIAGNRRVNGRYAFENGVLTFSDASGDTGPQQFPIRCRFEAAEERNGFRLADEAGSCKPFGGLTFTPVTG